MDHASNKPQHHGNRGAGVGHRRRGQAPAPAEETVVKKGSFPTGMVLTAALGLLFVCYLTNAGDVQTGIDAFFGAQVHSAHTHDALISSWFMLLLPYVAMALVLAVLYVLLASLGVGKTKRKPAPLTEFMTVHEFAEFARANGVGARVAREMYRMLLPNFGSRMRSTLPRPFADLDAAPETVWGMFEELVSKSGGIIRGHVGVEALGTPMEMMQAAERCVERVALERRAALQKAAATLEERHRTIVPVPAGRR